MAQIAKIEAKAETKCGGDKMYDFFKYKMTQLPNMFPQVYKNVQILEGENGHVGNLMLFEYFLGNTCMSAKFRSEEMNDVERSVTLTVVDGDIMNFYSSFVAKITASDGFVNWSLEFEKMNESAPNPDKYAELGVKVTKGIDLYLLNH